MRQRAFDGRVSHLGSQLLRGLQRVVSPREVLEVYAKKLQGLPGLGEANVPEHEETLADLSNALFEVRTQGGDRLTGHF